MKRDKMSIDIKSCKINIKGYKDPAAGDCEDEEKKKKLHYGCYPYAPPVGGHPVDWQGIHVSCMDCGFNVNGGIVYKYEWNKKTAKWDIIIERWNGECDDGKLNDWFIGYGVSAETLEVTSNCFLLKDYYENL